MKQGINCHGGNGVSFYETNVGIYDIGIMSHVLEHTPMEEIISQLSKIRCLHKAQGYY